MESILKTTFTVGANTLKPSSGVDKHVSGKLERLNKECDEKGVEKVPSKVEKGKGDKDKE